MAFVQENQPGPPPIGPHPRPTLGPRRLRRGMNALIQRARRHIQHRRNASRPTTPESQQLPPAVTPRTRRRAEVRHNNPLETPTRRRVPRPRNNSPQPPETPTRTPVPPSRNNPPEPPETPIRRRVVQPHQDPPRQRRKVGPRRMIARERINSEEDVTHSLDPFDVVYVLFLFMRLL